MLKIFIILSLLAFSSNINSKDSLKKISENPVKYQLYCSSKVEEILKTIQKLPNANNVIQKVLSEGSLSIKINHCLSTKFDGYWSDSNRTIYLTKSKSTSKGNLINTLLFELHNASRNSDFEEFDQLAYHRKITKKKYIEAVEYIEYQNALATSALIEEGIALKIFPQDARWNLAEDFSYHFSIQKRTGHSAWIGEMYDSLTNSYS